MKIIVTLTDGTVLRSDEVDMSELDEAKIKEIGDVIRDVVADQTGYLTIKRTIPENLVYPAMEVETVIPGCRIMYADLEGVHAL